MKSGRRRVFLSSAMLYVLVIVVISFGLWLSSSASFVQRRIVLRLTFSERQLWTFGPPPVVFSPLKIQFSFLGLLTATNVFLFVLVSRQYRGNSDEDFSLAHLSVVAIELLMMCFFVLGYVLCLLMSFAGLRI
ncbi:hypothetical protein E3J62_11835 [candidate division TA06 bacterium]|uniref:Uncharacterized protein n=1 Tax=candidate division TA06 bacterium TaxID=2250710 RepID=A0A523UNA7_UNCT6|nr:MAG: hypothetical protein E3J62_11835 [candidate division TA06 bacterium]